MSKLKKTVRKANNNFTPGFRILFLCFLVFFGSLLILHSGGAAGPVPEIIVTAKILGQTPTYIGAAEAGGFYIEDLLDLGINVYRLSIDMPGSVFWENGSARDSQWYGSGYGTPTIDEIKADFGSGFANSVSWTWWDYRFDRVQSRRYGVKTRRGIIEHLVQNDITPLFSLGAYNANGNPAQRPGEQWTPQPPVGENFRNEWWRHCFAAAYWLNVLNDYQITHFEVCGEPAYTGLDWPGYGGSPKDYKQLVLDAYDALHYANGFAGLPVHIHAPDAADNLQNVDPAVQSENPGDKTNFFPGSGTKWETLRVSANTFDSAMTTAGLLFTLAEEGIEGVTLFNMYDRSTETGENTGLIDLQENGEGGINRIPTETYYAYRLMARGLIGGKDRLRFSSSGVKGDIMVTRSGRKVYILAKNCGETIRADLSALGITEGTVKIYEYSGSFKDTLVAKPEMVSGRFTFTAADSGLTLVEITRIAGQLYVISPNGGEKLDIGTTWDIAWSSEGEVGNVKIEYTIDGGSYWNVITPNTENDGAYNWTVPGTPSDNCLIRVSEKDVDDGPLDVSNAPFSIVFPSDPRDFALRSPNGGESWEAGSVQEIKWKGARIVLPVKIEYSINEGVTWETVVKSTTDDGSYNWLVPNTPSEKCLARISYAISTGAAVLDPFPSDVSDAVFSILPPTQPAIKVTSPALYEKLKGGSRYKIKWEAIGCRDDVKIEYTTNGGSSWDVITPAAENTGKYEWLVPYTNSDGCHVRVSAVGGYPWGESGVFMIVSPSAGDLRVLSPNGGENWQAGSMQEIAWSGGDFNNARIDYSYDNGITWKTIVQSTPHDGSYDWTVPETVSDKCLVRVTANDGDPDPAPSDVSDDVFSIVFPGSTLRVISPNGGEQLVIGSRQTITWYATDTREPVKIEYSTTSGEIWKAIAESAENNGKYHWTIPDEQSDTCLVRISGVGGAPVDVSDTVFSIVPPLFESIIVTSPNGGESWNAGSVKEITWSSGDINLVRIDYSHDNGLTWENIVQKTTSDGSYDWTVPDTVSDECLVRVTAVDSETDPVPSDISDRVFSIVLSDQGEFKVTSPNGGEAWEVGLIHSITWTTTGSVNNVAIDYSYDNGSSWSTIEASAANSGAYNWTVPDTVSDECLVRVTANDGSGDPKPSDTSDEVFSIVRPSSPTIRVITPNGGEELIVGSTYPITWFSTDYRQPVKIEYSTNGGDSWTEIVSSIFDGDFDWLVPDEPSQICFVRISESGGAGVDVSDAVFSIVSPTPGDLTVLSPNGGENLEVGAGYNITWECSGINTVVIEYSINNGGTWVYIAEAPADNGSYDWTVPATPSQECLVRISGVGPDENPVDVSDGVFTIFDPSQVFIELFTPNGGESISVGVEYYITWASSGVTDVFIEYSTSSGDVWIPIDTVPAKGGRYTWVVPDTPSGICLVRISAPGTPASDVSDAVFTITPN